MEESAITKIKDDIISSTSTNFEEQLKKLTTKIETSMEDIEKVTDEKGNCIWK